MDMPDQNFDPAQTLSPDDPLRQWLNDPGMADWVRQKAIAHAQSVLGFADPYGNNIDSVSGMPTKADGTPVPPPNQSGVVNPNDPIRMPGQAAMEEWRNGTPLPTQASAVPAPKTNMTPFDPSAEETTPVPTPEERPKEAGPGASDVSAKKKGDKVDALSDFGKTLAGLKPMAPPPLNAVGTPSVRSPNTIQAPQLNQLLQLMGAQSKPDPVATLGRLLVAGKAGYEP